MIYCPPKYIKPVTNVNEELMKLEGELDDRTAQVSLAKFFRYNLGLTVDWVAGFKMLPYQEAALKAFFLRNFNMCVWGRGAAKSTMAAIACFFLPIFEPNTNIVIAGPTFRTARNIFSYMEKLAKSPEALLLSQCLHVKPSKRMDLYEWEINGGSVKAIPLNGEKIRGFRANVLVLDEFLLLSEDIVENVLMPFLIAPTDIKKRIVIREEEDARIKKGLMKDEEREQFKANSRMICLSSASYTFEHLYKKYKEWEDRIFSDKVEKATYFVNNVSYEALPEYMWEETIIEEAKKNQELHPAFKREYCAQFVDGSDSYFSAKKMHQLTVKDGEKPTTMIRGDDSKKYILSIDPNFSQSPSADYFAMAVLEIDEENEKALLVHNYGKAGVELKEHIKYFYYLMNAFNIVMICADNADGNFIQSANESALFQENRLKLDFIDYDGELQGQEYADMLRKIRNQYNLGANRICFKHVFNQPSIRRINEQMQTWINTNRIAFASRLERVNSEYEFAMGSMIPYPFTEADKKQGSFAQFVHELITTQDEMIPLVKKQCSLIEIRVSPTGGQIFDLPQSLKRNTSPGRARKDNYTALMLGIEGAKAYFDLMKQPVIKRNSSFVPMMFGNSTM